MQLTRLQIAETSVSVVDADVGAVVTVTPPPFNDDQG
jgi:hypothetical protein